MSFYLFIEFLDTLLKTGSLSLRKNINVHKKRDEQNMILLLN